MTAGGANDNDRGTEVVEPDCYGFIDTTDPSCRRCKAKDGCSTRQLEIRPECFGVEWSDEDVECQACLVASQCADAMEDDKMARRKVRMRKKPAAAKPEPKEEVVAEAEADENDYTEMTVAQLREECEERDLEPTGRKSVLVRRLLADDAGEEVDEEEAAKPEPPRREIKRRTVKKPAPKPEPEPEESMDFSFDALLDALEDGKTLVVNVTDEGYQVSMSSVAVTTATAAAQPQTKGLRGEAFWREVLDPAYYEFNYEDAGTGKGWYDMSPEEKVDFADELGVEWEEKDDARVTTMNMVRAVFKELGLTKYKPEYKKAAARNALK